MPDIEPQQVLTEMRGLLSRRGGAAPPSYDATATLQYLQERVLSQEELTDLYGSKEFLKLVRQQSLDVDHVKSALAYENDLERLQIELVKMQQWLADTGRRLVILFEGRDAAGKGGMIRRIAEYMNPRMVHAVALSKPTHEEQGEWYFQRYVKHLPPRGHTVLFDRSWYNRAIVEPVNGFCTTDQYELFMRQVPRFEELLVEDGISLLKFWFSVSQEVQRARLAARRRNPLKQWKLSTLDIQAQEHWDLYTKYKDQMMERTSTPLVPWVQVKANNKRRARLHTIRYILSRVNYPEHVAEVFPPDPDVVSPYRHDGPAMP